MMLRDARKQSGVGWNEERCMIQAEPHLWDKLETVSYFILTNSWYQNLDSSFIMTTFIYLIVSVFWKKGLRSSEKMDTSLSMIC
jgi:hypothetical protein